MNAGRWAALAAAGVVAAVAALLVSAPASLIDAALSHSSLGRVRLADADGSVWRGRGRIVLVDPAQSQPDRLVLGGFALPGAVVWTLRPLPLVFGLVDATVAIEPMAEPVRISGNPTELRITAGSLDLPSAELARLGSPWNTIRPSAALSLRWQSLGIRDGVLDGRTVIELRDVASAMTQVRPLGTYRIAVDGNGRDVSLVLSTLSGPLRLQGQGTWDRRAGVRFTAQARAEGADQVRLQSLLNLIGRREGDLTVVRIGG